MTTLSCSFRLYHADDTGLHPEGNPARMVPSLHGMRHLYLHRQRRVIPVTRSLCLLIACPFAVHASTSVSEHSFSVQALLY